MSRRVVFRVTVLSVLFTAAATAPALADLMWRRLANSPTNGWRHDDVSFVSPSTGWVVNTNGEIWKTTDGGSSWSQQLLQNDTSFRCVGFANELRGWTGNLGPDCFSPGPDSTLMYDTTDGGETWHPVTNFPEPAPRGLCGMWVVNEDVVYAVGRVCDTPRMVKTTNGGTTWETIDLSSHADRLIDCYFPTATTGFAVGGQDAPGSGLSHGVVLYTSDGGATWVNRHTTSENQQWCWKLTFPTATVGYVSVQLNNGALENHVLKTTDGGATWTEKPFPIGFYFEQGIGFATADLGWVGGDADTYETTDGGDTWNFLFIGTPRDDNVNRFRFLTPELGYAVGRKVYRWVDEDVVVDVPGLEKIVASDPDILPPPSPNPFREGSRIEFSVPVAGHVDLRLYNVMGHEVLRLVDAHRPAGLHSMELKAGQLASGVYALRLDTPTRSQSRKIHLVR